MKSVRLGLLLVRTQFRHDRWRLVSVAFATGVVAIVVGVLLAGQHVRSVAEQRAVDRLPVAAVQDRPSDTWFLGRAEVIGDYEIEIVAFDPVSPSSESVIPAGVATLPEPGVAVVSPALAELIDRNDRIAARFPNTAANSIDTAGLRDAGELLAYVRTPTPGSLDKDRADIRASAIGDGSVTYGSVLFLEPITDGIAASLFAAILFLIPAILILRAGVSARSEVLDQRVASMTRLGAPQRIIRQLLAVDTAVPAFVGACVGMVIVRLLSRRDYVVPFARFDVMAADLDPGVVVQAIAVVAITGCAAVATVLQAARKTRRPDSAGPAVGVDHTPSSRSVARRAIGFASIFVGPLLIVAGALIRGEKGGNIFLVGLLLFLLGLPKMLIALVTLIGRSLAARRSVELHLAGARISDSKQRTARLLISLVCLLVIVSIVQVFYTRFDPATSPTPAQTAAFSIVSVDPFDTASAQFLLDLDGVQAIVTQGPELTNEDPQTGEITDNTTFTLICSTGVSDCPTSDGSKSVASLFPDLSASTVASSITPTTTSTIDRLDENDLADTFRASVIVDTAAVSSSTSQIATPLSAPYFITDDSYQVVPTPIIGWVNLGLYAFVALTLVSIGLAYAAHVRTSSERNAGLVRLGIERTTLSRVIASEVAIPFTIATAIAAIISFGTAYLYAYLDGLNAPTLAFMIALTASTATVGVLVTIAAAAGGARSAERLAIRRG